MTIIAVVLSCVSFTNPVVNADASDPMPSATLVGSKKVVMPGSLLP